AFATDPTRGFFVLVLLAITVGGSLLLFAIKAPSVKAESSFSLLSRESFLLVNNIIFAVVAFTVLLGTIYPLIVDSLGLGKLSVGPPYFNAFFVPLMSLLVVFLGIGMVARWKNTSGGQMVRALLGSAVLSVVIGLVFPFLYDGALDLKAALGIALMAWIVLVCVQDIRNKIAQKKDKLAALAGMSRAYYGMLLAHIGVGITVVGIAMVSIYNEEIDIRMAPGDSVTVKEYTFTFKELTERQGPNFVSDKAVIEVARNGRVYSELRPEKRIYTVQRMPMTESDIDPGLFRDLYVAMGEKLDGGAWAIRIQHKPFVRWIWLGAIFMALGGTLAAMDKRYRKRRLAGATA
ncbi:MAG TPA: cytochrome c-type biogenesis CcmF C-terminal domain-containing protein, partial [Motiliproteus sp.]